MPLHQVTRKSIPLACGCSNIMLALCRVSSQFVWAVVTLLNLAQQWTELPGSGSYFLLVKGMQSCHFFCFFCAIDRFMEEQRPAMCKCGAARTAFLIEYEIQRVAAPPITEWLCCHCTGLILFQVPEEYHLIGMRCYYDQ